VSTSVPSTSKMTVLIMFLVPAFMIVAAKFV
jgi:hypothetical protein